MDAEDDSIGVAKPKRRSVLACGLLAVALAVGWGVDHWLCSTVTPLSRWEEWPDPFSHCGAAVVEPASAHAIARGSAEALYLEKVRKAMIEADEIALQMVGAYRRQAAEGVRYSARAASEQAEYRLEALRDDLVRADCPTQCIEVADAVRRTLSELARFYRVSGKSGRGFSAPVLTKAQRAAVQQAELCARYRLVPEVQADLLHAIVTNDCVALAHVVEDELRTRYVSDGGDWFIQRSGYGPKEQTPERKFYQANSETPYLRALWQVLDGEGYSPFLASAFLYWRADVQTYYFGMSEEAEIPNEWYNLVRFRVLERVKDYLRKNSNDPHALAQQEVLLGVPNIRRIRPYGNTCQYDGVWLQ